MKQLNEKNKDVDFYHGALLTLLGSDLRKTTSGQNKIKLALLQNGYSRDLCYEKESVFDSLRDHEFNEETHELMFPETGIILNISDLCGSEAVTVTNPRACFNWEEKKLATYALYHGDRSIVKIEDIDGVRGKKT